MADWFKFHENDLDEMRLQWAIHEMPEVLSVWIVLLSEACRHKDGTLSGYNEDFEMFGISKRINVSVPKINESINLLIKIKYVEKLKNGDLLIRKWNERQSEYCQRKTRLQNQTGDNNPNSRLNRTKNTDSVRTLSGHSPDSVGQEERRGEENIYTPRFNLLYHRRSTTTWSPKEIGALKLVASRPGFEEELAEIEKFYSSGYKYRRQDIQTLLNNWSGELDRARNNSNGSTRKEIY